jgi:hypothetical protein
VSAIILEKITYSPGFRPVGGFLAAILSPFPYLILISATLPSFFAPGIPEKLTGPDFSYIMEP